jgi:hypothetical protein
MEVANSFSKIWRSEILQKMERKSRLLPNIYVVEMGFLNLYVRTVHQCAAQGWSSKGIHLLIPFAFNSFLKSRYLGWRG